MSVLRLLLLFACGSPSGGSPPAQLDRAAGDEVVQEMRGKPLDLTRHGECRMACRHIDLDEVRAILDGDGQRDPARTRLDGDCPTHALEGETDDGQTVRIVYAACAGETRVVTAIDLDTDWPCDCL